MAARGRERRLQAEVGRADLVVAQEVGGAALHGDAAVFDDVAAVGDGEAVDDVVLDDEDGDAAGADVLDAGEDFLGDLGGEAEGGFVGTDPGTDPNRRWFRRMISGRPPPTRAVRFRPERGPADGKSDICDTGCRRKTIPGAVPPGAVPPGAARG